MNRCIFVGNLGGDPELRQTTSGKSVANFSLAIPQFGSDKPVWIRCTAWGKTAENAAKYLSKGRQVAVEGHLTPENRIKTHEVPVKGGGSRSFKVPYESFAVTIDSLTFLNDGKGRTADAGTAPVEDDFEERETAPETEAPELQGEPQGCNFSDDEIPF